MSEHPRGWRAVRHLLLLAALVMTAAYQVQRPWQLEPGDAFLDGTVLRGLYGAEQGFAWTSGRSSLVIPDPGPGIPMDVVLEVSAWRRRGTPGPHVVVEAAGASLSAEPPRQLTSLTLPVVTRGWWSSDLEVVIRSETFRPGPHDARELGIKLHRVSLVPRVPLLGWRRPPVGQLLVVGGILCLLFVLARQLGLSSAWAFRLAASAAVPIGLSFALWRPLAALGATPLLLLLAPLALLARLAPAAARVVGEILAEAMQAVLRSARQLPVWGPAALALAAALAVWAAYAARPKLEIDLGSGRETTLTRGFGAFDSGDDGLFRHVDRGARLDLRDFGGGSDWQVGIVAALGGPPRSLELVRSGEQERVAHLDRSWSRHDLQARPDWGWRAGLVLEFPSARGADLWIESVHIDRGRSFPPLRILAAVVVASLLVTLALGTVGLGPTVALLGGLVFLSGQIAALLSDPLVVTPFIMTWLGIAASSALLAGLLRGLGIVAERRGFPALPAAALAAVALGFGAWLTAMAFPLYRGGHFVFHSSVAHEIWNGQFLTYYLPYPGSMLSRQAQWGSVIVPHSCLYHTLVAPLAALPQEWFYLAEKAVLALMLSSMAFMAGMVGLRFGGPTAAATASIVFACLPPTHQLMGLGHLLTSFGCWASTLALTFLVFSLGRLGEGRRWWTAVALLTVCFLSYTAALLFTGVVLGAAIAFLLWKEPRSARSLATASLAAALAAFGLYYVSWAWPFLTESVPTLLGRQGARGVPWYRLAQIPDNLTYTYGSLLVPAAGFGGLALVSGLRERLLLWSWAAILVPFSVGNILFNFLHKHHYFVMLPVAVGVGLLLAALRRRGRFGRWLSVLLTLAVAALGTRMALATALGWIP